MPRPNVAVVEIGSDDDLGMEFSPMRQTGTVKFFNTTRGFGFITPETGGKDIFVHITALERSGLPALADGTRVTFSVEEDRRGRGPQAVDIQLA
jgi:CspA family cold shock protein